MNLREIETLRTKEELVNYFAQRGQSITEEEIESLKKSYEQVQGKDGALTLEQLDDVAGGLKVYLRRLATCRESSLRDMAKFEFGVFRNAFQVTKDGKTEITTSSGEKYIAMVHSYNGCGGSDSYELNLYHEETDQWIRLLPDDLNHNHPDLYEAIRTFIGDGEGLSLTPIDGVPVNEGRREHDRENQLVHSEPGKPSVLVDSFLNGHNRFDEPCSPYEHQIAPARAREESESRNSLGDQSHSHPSLFDSMESGIPGLSVSQVARAAHVSPETVIRLKQDIDQFNKIGGTALEQAEYVIRHIDQFSPETIEMAARVKYHNIETGRSQEDSGIAKIMPEHDPDSTMPYRNIDLITLNAILDRLESLHL